MNLRETQALFWRAISWPTGVEAFLAQASPGELAAFENAFAQTDAFGRRERLEVYAEAYFWRLFEVLADQYEVTAWLYSAKRFHNLVTDYVLQHPSTNPDVRRFGSGLATFIAEHEAERRVPGLADVARVEWSILEAVDAPDSALLCADDLATVPVQRWPLLRFAASPPTRLVPCALAFKELWRAHSAKEPSPTEPPQPQPADVLVWRQSLDVYQRTPTPAEAGALRAMLEGATFTGICEAALETPPSDVAGWLRKWLKAGLIEALA